MNSGRGGARPGAGAPVKSEDEKIKIRKVSINQNLLDLVEKQCLNIHQLTGKKISARQWIEQAITDRLQTKEVE